MTWAKDELRNIAEADDLHISPFREDGVTYGTPTWIWSVGVDGALYVRAYHGQNSRWYQAAVRQKAGRIIAAGMTTEVTFEPVDGPINDLIDDAYRAKYHGSPYLSPMISARATPPRSRSCRATPMPDRRARPMRNAGEGAFETSRQARAVKQRIKNMRIDILGSGSRTEDAAGRNWLTGSSALTGSEP
jgi:hypothetical protein